MNRGREPDLTASPVKVKIARSVFWVVWSRGVVQLISFVSAIVVARLLSPTDYGLMALAGVWTSTIALIAELGVGPAIVQFRDLEERELNTCFWLVMSAAVVSYLALYASAPAIAAWFSSPMLAIVLRVVGLNLLLVAGRAVPDGLLRKRLELDTISQAEIAAVLVTTPIVLGLAWSGAGVWALVAGALIMPLTHNIVSFWRARWRPGLRVGGRRLREIIRYSLAALGARVSWSVFQQADAFVLGKVAGDVVLGFYSMAKLLAGLPVDKISGVANLIASPVMAGLQTDRTAMRESFLRVLRLVACLTVPLCIGLALVADDLVAVVLTDKWSPIVPLLQVLSVFGLIRSLDVLLPSVLFARHRATFLFWWTWALLLVTAPALWAGATWRGALGAALALVVIYPLTMAWMAREAFRELNLGWKTVWRQLMPVLAAALPMVACVLVVQWTMPGAELMDRSLRLALAAAGGALVYTMAIIWRGGPLLREATEVAGWFLRFPAPSVHGVASDQPRLTSAKA